MNRMPECKPVAVALCLSATLAVAQSTVGVSPCGYAGVRIGMSVADASRASGMDLAPGFAAPEHQSSCYYVAPHGDPGGFLFMVVDNRIARVDIRDAAIRTTAGVGVGSSESEINEAYPGRVNTTAHPYTGPKGHYLTVEYESGLAIIFETDGDTVTSYRAGADPAVRWIEGCS